MSTKTELKLAISVNLMEQYHREGGGKYVGELKKLRIGFPEFSYKGAVQTAETDLTEKQIVNDLMRAGKGILAQFSMSVDSVIEDALKKNKVDTKNKKAVSAALGDIDDALKKDLKLEAEAAHKRLRALMAEIVKEHSGEKEGVNFKNEAQVARLLKSLRALPNLRRDYKVFHQALLTASKSVKPETQAVTIAKAYDLFINSEGVQLIESARKIPKVEPVKPDPKAEKEQKTKAASVNTMAEALGDLRKEIIILADELEALRSAYSTLQELMAGHADAVAAQQDDAAKPGGSAHKKQLAAIEKAFATFPDISEAHIKTVILSLEEAEKGLETYRKSAA